MTGPICLVTYTQHGHPYPFTVQYETREAAAAARLVKDDAVTMVRFEEAAPRA
jgi:hypothetical protein